MYPRGPPDMVHMGTGTSNSSTLHHRKSTSNFARSTSNQQDTPTLLKTEVIGSKPLKEQEPSNWILGATNNIICALWAPKTQQEYLSILNKWDKFCCIDGVLMQWKVYVAALRNHVANSLLDANIINIKYHAIWDINIVLIFLMNRSTENDMNYTRKLVCQFMLLSGTLGNTTVTFRDHQYVSDKPRM